VPISSKKMVPWSRLKESLFGGDGAGEGFLARGRRECFSNRSTGMLPVLIGTNMCSALGLFRMDGLGDELLSRAALALNQDVARLGATCEIRSKSFNIRLALCQRFRRSCSACLRVLFSSRFSSVRRCCRTTRREFPPPASRCPGL